MLIFIVLIVSAPFLVSKWQAFFKRIGLCFSRNGLLSRSATILGLPAVEPNVAHRCLKTVLGEFRRAMMLFFTFFRSSKSETKTAIPLTSDSLLHVASLPGDNMPKSLSESPLIEEAITRPIVPYMGIPRRLRRQGWLLQLPFRRNSSVLEERIISPPPSVLSASLILRDVRNIRPEVNVNSADSSFFPEVVELSADDIEMPIIIPVAAPPHGLPIPIPVLELTATQSECNSPIPFGSPLGPSSLTLAQPNAFSCLSEDEICTVNICPENSGIQLSKESDNSSLCLLDRFPQPPNAAEGKACLITPAGLDERDDSAPELLSPIEKAAAGQDGERKTAQHSEVAVHIIGDHFPH